MDGQPTGAWDYRILAHGEGFHFEIHEVYYDGQGKPIGYTENSVVSADDAEGIAWVLDKMKEAAQKPILSAERFPEEWPPKEE